MADETISGADRSEWATIDAPDGLSLGVLYSPDAPQIGLVVPLQGALIVGRPGEELVDLAFHDRRLSRRHARLRPARAEPSIEVEDLGSRNGTFVDRERVTSARVCSGQSIRFGDTLCEIGPVPAEASRYAQAEGVIGASASFARVLAEIERAAPAEISVLLSGETGTGKDVLARYLHARSGRAGAFVAQNCAAIPAEIAEAHLFGHKRGAFTGATHDSSGCFADAEGGTLFLDEVGELRGDIQAKLLRALENREIVPVGSTKPVRCDVRIVAATNTDLGADVLSGIFRRDLYARLSGFVIRTPPLRHRRADILPLAEHFLAQSGRRLSWSTNAVEEILHYEWPMNVRELKSTMQRLLLTIEENAELVRTADLGRALQKLPGSTPRPSKPAESSRSTAPSREDLVVLLTQHRGAVAALAAHYGKHRRQIHRWLAHHGLDPDDFA